MADRALAARLAGVLHAEAALLAERTRAYFDGPGQAARAALTPRQRVHVARAALHGTVRLTRLTLRLLARKVALGGAARPLAPPRADAEAQAILPPEARRLLAAGIDLDDRVRRLDDGADLAAPPPSPARSLLRRLERSL